MIEITITAEFDYDGEHYAQKVITDVKRMEKDVLDILKNAEETIKKLNGQNKTTLA